MIGFGSLALLVAVGIAGPLLAALGRFGPPLVVGEILAGVLIGRSGLDLVPVDDPALGLLSQIGFALLMLIVGSHLPLRDAALRPALRRAVPLTAAVGVLAAGLGVLLAGVTGLGRPALLAVLLATSSGAVALPVLQALDSDGIDEAGVLVATVWIALTDVATVLAVPLVLRTGGIGEVLLGIAVICALAAALYLVGRRTRHSRLVRRVRRRWRAGADR